MNYEAERAMNQKRLRMDGEPGHGVVQGNGIPLNYMDNGHQIPYQPYAGAYNTHYPPPDAFAAYGPPPPGGYAPQNLSYAPPAHQNYAHHQSFPPQQPQAQLHMAQTHMLQGYADVGMHKAAWPPQPHLLPPLDPHKPLDVKQLKPEIKVEPTDPQKRPHPEGDLMGGDVEQPKIKIKTDIFKPDDVPQRAEGEKAHDVAQKQMDAASTPDLQQQHKEDGQPIAGGEKVGDKPAEACKTETGDAQRAPDSTTTENKASEVKRELGSPDRPTASTTPGKITSPEGKKRGRPRGSTNKPKAATPQHRAPAHPVYAPRPPAPAHTPRGRAPGYQYAVRPFRKDFSGIQFRRRWSDDCLSSAHIPNEVYFGDVPVSTEVLFNYYDANAEREKLAAQAAQIAAQKAAAAKLAAAKLQARGILASEASSSDDAGAARKKMETQAAQIAAQMAKLQARGILAAEASSTTSDANAVRKQLEVQMRKAATKLMVAKLQERGVLTMSTEVTTVDSSSSDDSSGSSGSDDSDTDDDRPLKKTPGRPKGSKSSPRSKEGGGRRGRPPVPPELREPGITDMKRFCKLAGVRFDYKKLVEGCTKNKERVSKMMELLYAAGLEGKPTAEKCAALKQAKIQKKDEEKRAKQVTKADVKREEGEESVGDASTRRVTRGQTGVKPRQKIVISSDEEDDTPSARRTLSKLRSMCEDDEDSN